MIALYAVIRLDQRFQIKSFSYDRSDPVIKNHNSADDAIGASDIGPHESLSSNPTKCCGELVGKYAGQLRTGNQYCVPRRPNNAM